LQDGNAAGEAFLDVLHPAHRIDIVLSPERITHAEEFIDHPLLLNEDEIEGAELALDEVKGDAGSPAERLHHGRKIAVGKRFEIAIIEPAVLARRLVERGDCIFESERSSRHS